MSTNDLATDLLLQLLTANSMEPAARLKQRLNAKLIDSGMGPFDQKALGFKSFKDYLRSLGDRLSIEERSGSDILVSLGRGDAVAAKTSGPSSSPPLKSDVWLAFTNPDPERLRFYNKNTTRMEHQTAAEHARASFLGPDRIPVAPIDAAQQSAWMREFIALHALEADTLLVGIALTPYSSAVNAAFSRALGKRALAWRSFRANKVVDEVREWAARYDINFSSLQKALDPAPSVATGQSLSPRLRAAKLLESFSDQELVDLVIPILAASALVKSRA